MSKVGIFGGNFNPIHNGHINLIFSVLKDCDLDKIYVVPNEQSPGKIQIEGAGSQHRLEMVKLAVGSNPDVIEVDSQEIKRGGISYTIDTLQEYLKKYKAEELHLIIGLDAFTTFDTWKDFAKILEVTNLLIVSRPGYEKPYSEEDLAPGLRSLVAEFSKNVILFKSGRIAEFVQLEDQDCSATEVRKKLRTGQKVDSYLPVAVERHIKANGLYQPPKDRIGDFKVFTEKCMKFLLEKGAIAPRGFDLTDLGAPTDFTIVCSGTSTRTTTAMAENLSKFVKEQYGVYPLSFEGATEGRWVLLDYGALIVHIFYDYVRTDYNLEGLWKNAKELTPPNIR